MNCLKVYCNLIRRAKNRTPPQGYTEKHHIFPKSIFGDNNKIVVLTAREHYIAHCLLERICLKRYGLYHKNTQKMLCAHINMKSKNRYYNSTLYETAKIKRSESMKGSNHWNWKGGHKNLYQKKQKFCVNKNYKRYEYLLISPDGNSITTNSLRKTCSEYGLDHRTMNKVIKKERKQHKGWTGEVLENLSI